MKNRKTELLNLERKIHKLSVLAADLIFARVRVVEENVCKVEKVTFTKRLDLRNAQNIYDRTFGTRGANQIEEVYASCNDTTEPEVIMYLDRERVEFCTCTVHPSSGRRLAATKFRASRNLKWRVLMHGNELGFLILANICPPTRRPG